MNPITDLSIQQLRSAIKRRDLSVKEIAQAFLDRIETTDPTIRSFISVNRERALKEAESLDQGIASRETKLGFLTGIPIGVKDNIVTRGLKTTCGSKILENYIPPYDATVVRKLNENRSLILGKTNLDEFAMGSSTENSAFFPTGNPWNPGYVPGGSSGGSAAAVAARL
ncbi:MAG: Asp-tRNA(Asn)/Glu-tRNA(Gln) amidotransferase subunit GatA, partial [Acidobacteriota bacterium]